MFASITLAFAIYIVIWWITLMAVLPWGVKSQVETGKVVRGSERGAPVKPSMWKKLGVTTVVSAVILAAGYGLFYSGFDRYILPAKYLADRQH